MADRLIRAVDFWGRFRFFVAETTEMVEEMRNIHRSSPTATAGLGRLLTMMSLLSLQIDEDLPAETVTIKGNGPAGYLVGVTDSKGHARVSCAHPEADVPSRSDHHLDVGSWVGREGTLNFVRANRNREPFSGLVPLVSGEIAEDFASYFAKSEQTPTVVSLGVLVETDYHVAAAGGILIQALPGTTEEDFAELEACLEKLPPMTKAVSQGENPGQILSHYFSALKPDILEELPVSFACPCSREKMLVAVQSLPEKDRREMAVEDGGCEVECEFCHHKYRLLGKEFWEENKANDAN